MSEATLEAEAPPKESKTAVETETAAPETTTSTTATEAPETAPAKAVGGVEAYKKLKDEVLAGKVPAELAEAAPKQETPAPTETPATEETPPPAEPESPVEDHTPDRIRLKGLPDGHLVAAANEIARAEGIPFAEAFTRVAPKPSQPAAVETTAAETAPKRTRADVEKEIADAKAERKAAAVAADGLEAGAQTRLIEAEEKLEGLREELGQIDIAEAEEEQRKEDAARVEFNTRVETSQAKAVEYWPESADKNSALSKRTLEIADAYEKDPNLAHMVSEADSPFYFVSMAAKELGLLPVKMRPKAETPPKASTSPTATKPAPVNQRAVGRPTTTAAAPASGAQRTTGGENADPLGLDKIRTVADYEKVKSQLTGQKL